MDDLRISGELLDFIGESPSMFHTAHNLSQRLEAAGFTRLRESEGWRLEPGRSYYVLRNNSSTLAFRIGEEVDARSCHFQICASHGDSPSFKVKSVGELAGPGGYLRLNVEAYGGGIDGSWLDRPLSLAGRVLVREGSRVVSRLFAPDRDLLLIPSVAIHMNRDVNKGMAFNRQVDLCPLLSAGELKRGALDALIADDLGVSPEQVLGRDLFLTNRQPGLVWGAEREFVSSPKLDDLQCAFVSLEALLASENPRTVSVLACFDNEEVGSGTKQGALSTFLRDVLLRVCLGLGGGNEDYLRAQARSFMVSCDNAHAVHPNHPELTDDENHAWLNQGIVVKEAANQAYTTDAFSRSLFAAICADAGVPVQAFANRSDSAGGSTLGNLSNMQMSMHAVDMGLPQLAMHSSFETAGVRDTAWALQALAAFYGTNVQIDEADAVTLG
ncbi:M18 family aminopeptidase [Olsenella urininfantis]|uniref:M18 family aminopeptidase n=1 Tax=Olsenella urininfantis TaxID=1871033 RepID=UPI000985F315|nr:M18 family aminopeptidase [Olsenella urininfantis]